MPDYITVRGTSAIQGLLFHDLYCKRGPHITEVKKGGWPGKSPDLNYIENIWARLKYWLGSQPDPANTEDLIKLIRKGWKKAIDAELLESCARSMPGRLKECIASGGLWTDNN